MTKRARPKVVVPRTGLDRILDVAVVIGVVGVMAIAIWGWLALPAVFPTHFGVTGNVDRYGGKGTLIFLPLLTIGLAVLLSAVARYPSSFNYAWPITEENAARQYYLGRLLVKWISVEVILVLLTAQWLLVEAGLYGTVGMLLWILLFELSLIIVTLFVYLRLAKRAR